MAGQLPPDVLEGLMLVEAANPNPGEGQGQGGMPGGFGEEDDFAFEDDEEHQPQVGVFAEVRFNEDAGGPEQPQHDATNAMAAAPPIRQPQSAPGQDDAVDQDDGEEDEEEEEEEYISVRFVHVLSTPNIHRRLLANAPCHS